MTDTTKGVWMLYDWDNRYHLETTSTEIESLVREVAQRGYGKVGWLPIGVPLEDACKAWESSEPLEIPNTKVDWRDPAPQSNEEVADSLTKMAKSFGAELDEWQSRAVRYFMGGAVGEEKP